MKRSFPEEKSRTHQIRKLTEVSRAITYAASLDEVFRLTVDRAVELVAAKKSLLMVADEDGLLTVRASHGIDAALARSFHEPLNEALVPGLARQSASRRRAENKKAPAFLQGLVIKIGNDLLSQVLS